MVKMGLQNIAIEKIKHAKYNPRKDLKPGDVEYEKLKRSMEEFGYVEPIVWNERTGNIVGGHQRFKVLVAQGKSCLLYTSDAADEEDSVDLGGRRIIKK